MKQNSIVKTTIVTVFVTFCLCAAAQPGLASCGDYLHTKHGKPENSAQQSQQNQNDDAETDIADRSPFPDSAPPCQGPFCSKSDFPQSPFAPASLELKVRAEAFLNALQGQLQASSPRRSLLTGKARQLTGYHGKIDHPPKAVC